MGLVGCVEVSWVVFGVLRGVDHFLHVSVFGWSESGSMIGFEGRSIVLCIALPDVRDPGLLEFRGLQTGGDGL